MSCLTCKLPVSERQQPFFLGWFQDGNCGWIHRNCYSEESILPGSPIAQSTRLGDLNDYGNGEKDNESSALDDLDSTMQATSGPTRAPIIPPTAKIATETDQWRSGNEPC